MDCVVAIIAFQVSVTAVQMYGQGIVFDHGIEPGMQVLRSTQQRLTIPAKDCFSLLRFTLRLLLSLKKVLIPPRTLS